MATKHRDALKMGHAAYAFRAGSLFEKMAARARLAFTEAGGSWDEDEDTDVTTGFVHEDHWAQVTNDLDDC